MIVNHPPNPDIDPAIAHLDIPLCQWRPDCNRIALWRIRFHFVNHCSDTPCCEHDAARTDPNGNKVLTVCGDCFEQIRQEVAAYVWRLNRFGRAICSGCGGPVRSVTDVIRERIKL